jgi:hypothetical protein
LLLPRLRESCSWYFLYYVIASQLIKGMPHT